MNENKCYLEEIKRAKCGKILLENELNIVKQNKQIIEEELLEIKKLAEENKSQKNISVEEYTLLEEKSQKLMELILKNKEAYDYNNEKLKQKNSKKFEKIAKDLNLKIIENNDLIEK